jgi:hypothetical protein
MAYSLAEGARYYGIGNEFMGAWIGAAVIGAMLLMEWIHASAQATRAVLLCGLLLGAAIIGAPQLGANMGGAISVVAAFGVALVATTGRRPRFVSIIGIVLAVVGIIAVFAAIDLLAGHSHQSHLGKAIELVRTDGVRQIGMLITRKLSMNLLLIRVSVWSRLVLAYLISMIVVLKAKETLIKLRPMTMYMRTAVMGTVSGTVVALVFNDSGIVAAATCLVYLWSFVVLVVLDKEKLA